MTPETPGDKPTKEPGKGTGKPTPKATTSKSNRRIQLRIAVVVAVALVGGIAWFATRDNESDPPEATPIETAVPQMVSVADLRETATKLGYPVYWAGSIDGTELGLLELSEGVQVLYLPEGADPEEDASKSSPVIGSYPLDDPQAALDAFAKRPGSTVHQADDGREVVTSEQLPTNVYFTSPDNAVQVETYNHSAEKALTLALSGQVQPVD